MEGFPDLNFADSVPIMVENSYSAEADRALASLGDSIEESMAILAYLETVEWEIQSRQVEVQNVTTCLATEEEKLQTEGDSEDGRTKIRGLQEHLNSLNHQLANGYQSLNDYRKRAAEFIGESQTRGARAAELLVDGWLLHWRQRQKLSLIGAPNTGLAGELDSMEPVFDRLLKELLRLRQTIDGLGSHMNRTDHLALNGLIAPFPMDLNAALSQLNQQMVQFLDKSVVIAVQPPPIMMITRTPASDTSRRGARPACQPVLSDFEAENIQRNPLSLEQLISERSKDKHQGPQLINSQSTMTEQNSRYFAQFPNMHVLRREKAAADSGAEKVPKRRYYALFSLSVAVPGLGSSVRIAKLSLPILLVTHPKQIRQQGGDAFIFWELAFSPGDGILKECPESGVPWHQFAEALNYKFLQMTGATRGLDDSCLSHLAGRLLKPGAGNVTKDDFFDRVLGKDEKGSFTFRKWFFACAQLLIDRQLMDHWNNGLIAGFMSSAQSAQIVSQYDEPSLLIRFSDSRRDIIITFGSKEMAASHVLPRPEEAKSMDHLPLADVVKSTAELLPVRWIHGLGGQTFSKEELLVKPPAPPKTNRGSSDTQSSNEPYKFIRPIWCIDAPPLAGSQPLDDNLYNWVNSVGRESQTSVGASSSVAQECMEADDFS